MSTDERRGDPHIYTRIRITPDTRITVRQPYTTHSESLGAELQIPFYVHLGYYGNAECDIAADRADLTRLRDALTDALDAEQGAPS